jgi:hypothetical protein
MAELSELYQTRFKDVSKMSKAELAEEVELWRRLWTWLDEDVKYYLTRIGQPCRVVNRAYQGYLGRLLQPHFAVKELEVECVKVEYNYDDGEYYEEYKTLRLPISMISHIEFVHERERTERRVMQPAEVLQAAEEEIKENLREVKNATDTENSS